MPSHSSPLRRLFTLALPLMLVVGTAVPVAAHDDDDHTPPSYTAAVAPANVPAGRSTASTITITELTTVEYGIRSVRVTAPAGLSVTGATAVAGSTTVPVTVSGNSATIENVSLKTAGQTLAVTVTAAIACGAEGSVSWSVNARTTRTYASTSGVDVSPAPGSSLSSTIVPCSLDFGRQPALAGSGAVITSVAADPTGPSVTVRLLDGTGQPADQAGVPVTIDIAAGTGSPAAVLGGSTSDVTNANGVASFAPTIGTPASGYRLRATAGAGITGTTSALFDIAGVAKVCNGACGAVDTKSSTTATIDATTSGGLLTLTLGLGSLDCNNAINKFYVSSSEALLFDVTQATGRVVVTMQISAASVNRKTKAYQVCFSSPVSTFKNRYGTTIAAGSAGVLPDCWRGDDDDDDHHVRKPLPVGAQACTEKRWKDRSGNVLVRFSVPPGDPRGQI